MKVTVKTMWGAGIVSVNSKYVNEAVVKGEGLEIHYKDNVMSVTLEELKKKTPRNAKFNDKFGRVKEYTLYDFFWKS